MMNPDRPSYANAAGDFVVDIYQPADEMVEDFPNGPYELVNYECAVIEAYIPRLMWRGFGIGLSYQYSNGRPKRLAFQKEWFSSVKEMLNYINVHILPDERAKPTIKFTIETFVHLHILGSADPITGTKISFDVATRDLLGFPELEYHGAGTSWVVHVANGLPTFASESSRFLAITADFVAPVQTGGVAKQTLALAPMRADADWGSLSGRNIYSHPVYRRLQQSLLGRVQVKLCDPKTGRPFHYSNRQVEKVKAFVRLHFRPILKYVS